MGLGGSGAVSRDGEAPAGGIWSVDGEESYLSNFGVYDAGAAASIHEMKT